MKLLFRFERSFSEDGNFNLWETRPFTPFTMVRTIRFQY